jgi:integrase
MVRANKTDSDDETDTSSTISETKGANGDGDVVEYIDGIRLITEPSAKRLNERQLVDYRNERESFVNWMLHLGKHPEQAKGYAHDTARRRAYDIDLFARWVWNHEGTYTMAITHEHGDEYTQELVYDDCSDTRRANTQKAMKCFFRWKGDPWEPSIRITTPNSMTNPRDYLTKPERRRVEEASMKYGTVPSYSNLSDDERQEWKIHLAKRLRKPAEEVTKRDFRNANGFKFPSLVSCGLDAGLRPVEVARAMVSWCDIENSLLRIPKEESSKGSENWRVPIRDRTATMLEHWLEERAVRDEYAGTDILWLNREGNPYNYQTLGYLLDKLCEISGIDTEHRSITWYSVRHSTGTYMSREEGLKSAMSQLRHKRIQTTMKYDQAPPDTRRDALDRIR